MKTVYYTERLIVPHEVKLQSCIGSLVSLLILYSFSVVPGSIMGNYTPDRECIIIVQRLNIVAEFALQYSLHNVPMLLNDSILYYQF